MRKNNSDIKNAEYNPIISKLKHIHIPSQWRKCQGIDCNKYIPLNKRITTKYCSNNCNNKALYKLKHKKGR